MLHYAFVHDRTNSFLCHCEHPSNFLLFSLLGKMTDQDVKYLEDLQEEFDFRYKTIQSLGKSFCNNF